MAEHGHLWVQYHLVPESVLVHPQSTVGELMAQIAESFGLANPGSLRLLLPHSRGTCPGWVVGGLPGTFAAETVGWKTTVGQLVKLVFGDQWMGTINPAWADFIEVIDTPQLEDEPEKVYIKCYAGQDMLVID
ncbi:hypothetical protein HDU87_004597 [Geranomyces variabilis]|uniref:Uncharacterized protein n=1 Tax=Geranomyces variabilis TaxID=109894 RepID=A0AAD5TKC4_9FUNG|nr:hypothetical protein HDU87_004597 [Geranomyces variabilis]